MNIVQKDFRVNTRSRNQMVDISRQVASIVNESGISAGDVIVYCPHTTAAITINENADPTVPQDMLLTFGELIPKSNAQYRHLEGNSDSHCKSSLVGCSEQIMIKDGAVVLGSWQGIFFCEFDGPRSRRVLVQVRGE